SVLLVFTISFDNITASLFWRPPGVETMPTQILAMLKISISPEINALGTLMILITVGLPLAGGLIGRILFGNPQKKPNREKQKMKLSQTMRLERLKERYQNGGMDRRTFLGLTAAALASAGLTTRWSGAALAAVTEVRFDGWGGVVQ